MRDRKGRTTFCSQVDSSTQVNQFVFYIERQASDIGSEEFCFDIEGKEEESKKKLDQAYQQSFLVG